MSPVLSCPSRFVLSVLLAFGLGCLLAGAASASDPPPIEYFGLETQVYADPVAPTDLDSLDILISHRPNTCGWSSPKLLEVERSANRIRIDIGAYPGFGGGLPPNDLAEPIADFSKCTPPSPYTFAQKVPLGQLDPGVYEVLVYLNEITYDDVISGTALVGRRVVEVDDAPNVAFLGQLGRFEVRVSYADFRGTRFEARPVADAAIDSGLFTFFGPNNWEVMVKVLDGCGINGHYWVYTAAATDLEYEIVVLDLVSGAEWRTSNPFGTRAPATADVDALSCF